MGDMTKNFSRAEFACQCGCGSDNISPALVVLLQEVRDDIGQSMKITSGVRCRQYNASIGGVDDSAHVPADLGLGEKAHASDIAIPNSRYRYTIMPALYRAGFKRIGIGKGFIHVDIDTRKPPDVLFDYYK